MESSNLRGKAAARRVRDALKHANAVCGQDDVGRFYCSHDELRQLHSAERASYYSANASWWTAGGYGGSSDESAMLATMNLKPTSVESAAYLDGLCKRLSLPQSLIQRWTRARVSAALQSTC